MNNISKIVFVFTGILASLVLIFFIIEIWSITRKKKKKTQGVCKSHIIRFDDYNPRKARSPEYKLHLALSSMEFIVPTSGKRLDLSFLQASCGSLKDNAVLRLLVESINSHMRNEVHVSSRNLYLLSIDVYHRQAVDRITFSRPSDTLVLECNGLTAMACVSLHGDLVVRSERCLKTMLELHSGKRDVVLLNLNPRYSRLVFIDVSVDVLVLRFSTGTGLV